MLPEKKEALWVFVVRLDQVCVKIRAAGVFVFTAGIRPLTGEEQIIPCEGALGVAGTLAEVLDVLSVLVQVAFAVSAATDLHGVEFRANLSPFLGGGRRVGPLVMPMVIECQAGGSSSSVESMHGSGLAGRDGEFRLELGQTYHPVTFQHEVVARTEVGKQFDSQGFAFVGVLLLKMDQVVVTFEARCLVDLRYGINSHDGGQKGGALIAFGFLIRHASGPNAILILGKDTDAFPFHGGEHLRAVGGDDELNKGECIRQRSKDQLLPLWVQMHVYFVDHDDAGGEPRSVCAKVGVESDATVRDVADEADDDPDTIT